MHARTHTSTDKKTIHYAATALGLVQIHNVGRWIIQVSISASQLWNNSLFAKPTPVKTLQIPLTNENPINSQGANNKPFNNMSVKGGLKN